MTTIDKCLDLDLDLAPARRTPVMRLMDALSLPLTLLRIRRNRQEIAKLEEFNDYELADIGLTRGDVRAALSGGPLSDPSEHLTGAARYRRPVFRHK